MNRSNFVFLLVAVTAIWVSQPASAAMLSTLAADNATVQPAGPRSGGSGKAFFNIEGSANGSFASYGVADFNYGAQPTVLGINSAKIELTQSNAGFSKTGDVILSLDTTSPLVDIQAGTSPLAYDGVDPGTATDVSDGDLTLVGLGTGTYTVGASGDVDSYPLTLTPAITAELISRLNSGGTIRIVFGTGTADVAATWAGFSNTSVAGPTLIIDANVVPEPAALALLALALVPLTCGRKR